MSDQEVPGPLLSMRRVARAWQVVGLVAALMALHEQVSVLRQGEFAWWLAIAPGIVCLAALISAQAVLSGKKWGVRAISILACVVGVYCLVFLVMVGGEFHFYFTSSAAVVFLLAAYTLWHAYKRHAHHLKSPKNVLDRDTVDRI